MAFISRSRTKSNRLDAAKEIKGLVFFSNIVVSPLLEDVDVSAPPLCASPHCSLKQPALF